MVARKIVSLLVNYARELFVDDRKKTHDASATAVRFRGFDGLRGLFALFVLVNHSLGVNADFLECVIALGWGTGVIGFFVLSAFLLTHRLLVEFTPRASSSAASCCWQIAAATWRYALKRLCRIYVPFCIFGWLLKHGPPLLSRSGAALPSLHDIVRLRGLHRVHLWTIPPEIKYYACIPLICLACTLLGRRYALLLAALGCVAQWLNERHNFFGNDNALTLYGAHFDFMDTQKNWPYFQFLWGSIFAVALHAVESNDRVRATLKRPIVQWLISAACFATVYFYFSQLSGFWKPVRESYMERTNKAGVIALFLFLMAVGAPNFVTDSLDAPLLRGCGKYSFGIYLFHFCFVDGPLHDVYYKSKYKMERTLVTFLVSYFVGFIFYGLVENPMMKLAACIARQNVQLGCRCCGLFAKGAAFFRCTLKRIGQFRVKTSTQSHLELQREPLI